MTASLASTTEQSRLGARPEAIVVGIAAFAFLELVLAAFMAFYPHSFYTAIGPFGAFNVHYLRDVASFEGALGVALAVSLRRPSWRVPVLALTTIQFALHSVNHLIDIDGADPAWTGYFDFLSLTASTALLLWLLAGARSQAQKPIATAERGAR
jgi:hypothetical protein